MAEDKKTQQNYGGGLTSMAAKLYNEQAPERNRQSTGSQLLETGLELAEGYYKLSELTKNAFLETFDPETYEVELLPKESRGDYTNFAQGLKKTVSDNAAIAGKYSANPMSEQYKAATQEIEDAKGQLEDVYKGYTEYQKLRETLLANPNGMMTGDADKDAIYNNIVSEEGYKNLVATPDGLMYKDPAQDGKLIPVKDLGLPDFKNPELGTSVNNGIFVKGINLGLNASMTEDIATRDIRNSAYAITSNPASVKEIMFYGINGDPEMVYADYYIMKQAAAGADGYEGITFTNSDGTLLTAKDVDKNNDGTISVEEKAGLTVNQEAFDAKLAELKKNTDVDVIKDYTAGMNEWLIATGMEQYEIGVNKRKPTTITPTANNQKLATFDTNSQNLDLQVLEKPDGKYLKKDPTTKKWYEVKTPGEKIDIEGADGYDINYWRANVFGLPEVEGGGSTTAAIAGTKETETSELTKADLASTKFKDVDYPANSNFGNVDSPFAGLTQKGWKPTTESDIGNNEILFNFGGGFSGDMIINTLTKAYGDIGDGFTFEDKGLASDYVRVCYGESNCREFEFDTISNDNDEKSALALQKWMEEKIGYGEEESTTSDNVNTQDKQIFNIPSPTVSNNEPEVVDNTSNDVPEVVDNTQNTTTLISQNLNNRQQQTVKTITIDGTTGANRADILVNGQKIETTVMGGMATVVGIRAEGGKIVADAKSMMGNQSKDIGEFKLNSDGTAGFVPNQKIYKELKGKEKELFDTMVLAMKTDPEYVKQVLGAVKGNTKFDSKNY